MLFNFEALQSSLKEQESGFNYLSTTVKEIAKKAPAEISQKYKLEFEEVEGRWKKLSTQLLEHCQKLEEHMSKLRKIQVSQAFASYIHTYFPHSNTLYNVIGIIYLIPRLLQRHR